GVDPDRFSNAGQRLWVLLLTEIDRSQVVVSPGVLWVDFDRLLVRRDRTVHIALDLQFVAHVVMGQRVLGVKSKRLLVCRKRAVHIALLPQRVTQVVV